MKAIGEMVACGKFYRNRSIKCVYNGMAVWADQPLEHNMVVLFIIYLSSVLIQIRGNGCAEPAWADWPLEHNIGCVYLLSIVKVL